MKRFASEIMCWGAYNTIINRDRVVMTRDQAKGKRIEDEDGGREGTLSHKDVDLPFHSYSRLLHGVYQDENQSFVRLHRFINKCVRTRSVRTAHEVYPTSEIVTEGKPYRGHPRIQRDGKQSG